MVNFPKVNWKKVAIVIVIAVIMLIVGLALASVGLVMVGITYSDPVEEAHAIAELNSTSGPINITLEQGKHEIWYKVIAGEGDPGVVTIRNSTGHALFMKAPALDAQQIDINSGSYRRMENFTAPEDGVYQVTCENPMPLYFTGDIIDEGNMAGTGLCIGGCFMMMFALATPFTAFMFSRTVFRYKDRLTNKPETEDGRRKPNVKLMRREQAILDYGTSLKYSGKQNLFLIVPGIFFAGSLLAFIVSLAIVITSPDQEALAAFGICIVMALILMVLTGLIVFIPLYQGYTKQPLVVFEEGYFTGYLSFGQVRDGSVYIWTWDDVQKLTERIVSSKRGTADVLIVTHKDGVERGVPLDKDRMKILSIFRKYNKDKFDEEKEYLDVAQALKNVGKFSVYRSDFEERVKAEAKKQTQRQKAINAMRKEIREDMASKGKKGSKPKKDSKDKGSPEIPTGKPVKKDKKRNKSKTDTKKKKDSKKKP